MYVEYRDYNLMLDRDAEGFIGYRDDMIKYYKEYAKKMIDYLNKDFDNVNEIMDLLEELAKVGDNYLIYACYGYNKFVVNIVSKEV